MVVALSAVLPRAFVQARRDREADLIHRGRQYERAIQLYFRKFRRYPAKLEDLENTNGIRFLRRRFSDPITGSDEWRIIHIGANGMLVDSVVQTPSPQGSGPMTAGTLQLSDMTGQGGQPSFGLSPMAPQGQSGAGPAAGPGAQNPAQVIPGQVYIVPGVMGGTPGSTAQPGMVQRGGAPQQGFGQPVPNAYPGMMTGQPGQPGAAPMPGMVVTPGVPGGVAGGMAGSIPGLPAGVAVPGTVLPGDSMNASVATTTPGMVPIPGQPGVPGQPGGQQMPGGFGPTFGAAPGSAPATGTPTAGGGQVFGGGIAGVASKSTGSGFNVYNGRENYNEWEFVYDFRRDPLLVGAAGGGGLVPPAQTIPGLPGQQPPVPLTPNLPGQPGAPGATQPRPGFPGGGLPGGGPGGIFNPNPPNQPVQPGRR